MASLEEPENLLVNVEPPDLEAGGTPDNDNFFPKMINIT